jgi:hypothetical protein
MCRGSHGPPSEGVEVDWKSASAVRLGLLKCGAGEMNRTPDLLITNDKEAVFYDVDRRR